MRVALGRVRQRTAGAQGRHSERHDEQQGDQATSRETPGPVRFMLEVEVLDPDDTHVFVDGGTFDTQAQAVTEVERITRDGICVAPEPAPDVGGAATCFPPARHLRTRVLKVWF